MITLSSKVVSEFLGKRHDNLLRTIKTDIKNLENPDRYYKETTCRDGKGKSRTWYEVSIEGCERLAKRLSEEEKEDFLSKCMGKARESPETDQNAAEREYTVKEVAEALGISERTVRRRIESGEIMAVQREYQQIIVYTRAVVLESELKRYVNSRED